jgi:hypothetical protein
MDRQTGGWAVVSILLPIFHWLVPFLGMISRHVRRRPAIMCGWAIFLLIVHFIDMYWLVMPSMTSETGPLGGGLGVLTTVLCLLGMIGLFTGVVLRTAESAPLVPVRDPRLEESLAFHNV